MADINILMCECWKEFYSVEARLGNQAAHLGEKHRLLAASMRSLVSNIFVHLVDNPKFPVDKVYPMRPSPLTPTGFMLKEAAFKQAIMATLASHENEALRQKAQREHDKAKQTYDDIISKEKPAAGLGKALLPGEGEEFVASGLPAFSMLDLMGGGEDDGGATASRRTGAARFETFLNKHKGSLQAIPGSQFDKAAEPTAVPADQTASAQSGSRSNRRR